MYLSDVRLRPWRERLDRADHALDLHARVRRASSAIRLVYRETRDFSEPPVRVRAAESDLYDDEQAQAASVGAGRYRDGLGRSPDADDQRAPPSGLYPREHSYVRRQGGRSQARQRDRSGAARVLRARGPEQARRTAHGGARSAESSHHELSRGQAGNRRMRQ